MRDLLGGHEDSRGNPDHDGHGYHDQAYAAEREDHGLEPLGRAAGIGMHVGLREADTPQAHGRGEAEDHRIAPDLAALRAKLKELGVPLGHEVHGGDEPAVARHDGEEQDEDHDREEHALHGVDPGRAFHAAHNEVERDEGGHEEQSDPVRNDLVTHGFDHDANGLYLRHEVRDGSQQHNDRDDNAHAVAVALAEGRAHGHPLASPAQNERLAVQVVPEEPEGHEVHGQYVHGTESHPVAQARHAYHAEGTQKGGQHAEDEHEVAETGPCNEVVVGAVREPAPEGHVADEDRDQADGGDDGNGEHYASSFTGPSAPNSERVPESSSSSRARPEQKR